MRTKRASWKSVGVALLAAVAAGCGGDQAGPVEPSLPDAGPLRLAVIPSAEPAGFWRLLEGGARRAAASRDATLLWKSPGSGEDPDQAVRSLESAFNENASVAALAPPDARSFARLLQAPNPRRIPLVVLHPSFALEPDPRVAAVVAIDHRVAGENAGYELARLLNGKGAVALFRHEPGNVRARNREEGFRGVVEKHPGLRLLSSSQYAGADRATAERRVEELWPRFREADGFFASGEPGALALAAACARDPGRKRFLVAYGSSPALVRAVETGGLHALVIPLPDRLGAHAVAVMDSIARGVAPAAQADPAVALVTTENRWSPEIQLMLGER